MEDRTYVEGKKPRKTKEWQVHKCAWSPFIHKLTHFIYSQYRALHVSASFLSSPFLNTTQYQDKIILNNNSITIHDKITNYVSQNLSFIQLTCNHCFYLKLGRLRILNTRGNISYEHIVSGTDFQVSPSLKISLVNDV